VVEITVTRGGTYVEAGWDSRREGRAGIQYGGHIQNGGVDRMSGMSSILRIHPERACPRSQRAD